MSERTHAVLYAAKSTEDKHGSIPTQIEDCRQAAEAEGREVVAEYRDEAKSGYSGNRGPGLADAQKHAERLGAELWVQHTDRLARGDGKTARHLVQHVLWSWEAGVSLRSVQDDDACRDLLYAVVNGQRNHEDSARKSAATRAGLKRRKERGSPVGPIPLGYKVESKVVEGQVLTSRVIDPATAATVERIFALVESGSTFGDVARILNPEGILTSRGENWVSRNVRRIVHNRAYVGEKGYSAIIDAERFEDIHKGLRRLDPVKVAKRQGGRKPVDDSYFLRGIASCAGCGSTLYTTRQAVGRVYVCAHRRQGTGICHAPPIPAEVIESHVLRHLDSFVGSVEGWIAGRVEERSGERDHRETALERDREHLRDLEHQRERQMSQYRKLDDEGTTTAYIVLEEVERIDRERADQLRRIDEGEAMVSEWSGPPDVDAALDFYSDLVDQVQGRIKKADGARELNDALSTVVSGLWAEIEEDRDRLLVTFELVGIEPTLPGGAPDPFSGRPTLPPRLLDDRLPPEPLTQTRTQTKVNRCLAEGRARLRQLGAL